jgi:PleD family two-component response regulator
MGCATTTHSAHTGIRQAAGVIAPPARSTSATGSTARSSPQAARPERLVIADHESSSRIERLLGELERAFAHTLLATAERGRDALAACHHDPDILIIDPNISEINGIEVTREWLKRPRAPRLIFVSKNDRHALTAFEVQTVDYLVKPVHPERLLAARSRGQFRSIRDLVSRAERDNGDAKALANADALRGVPGPRLQAVWAVGRAAIPDLPLAPIDDTGTELPLPGMSLG